MSMHVAIPHKHATPLVYFLQESEQNQPAASQGSLTEGHAASSLFCPVLSFVRTQLHAVAVSMHVAIPVPKYAMPLVYFLQESEQNQAAASQGSLTGRTGSLSPPMSPFGGDQLQAAAERTAVTDARFSSLQRLSGTASTSDTGTQQVSCSIVHTLFHSLARSLAYSFIHLFVRAFVRSFVHFSHSCVQLLDLCLPSGSGVYSPV